MGESSGVTKPPSSLMIGGESSPLGQRNFRSPLERDEDTRFNVQPMNSNVDKMMLTGIMEAMAEEDFNEEYSISNDSDIVIVVQNAEKI